MLPLASEMFCFSRSLLEVEEEQVWSAANGRGKRGASVIAKNSGKDTSNV